jgi:hypothetical protein
MSILLGAAHGRAGCIFIFVSDVAAYDYQGERGQAAE